MYAITITSRRHEATNGRTHADDARTTKHDASSSTDDDAAGEAGHDETRQIRLSGLCALFVSIKSRCVRRTLGLNSFYFFIFFFKPAQPVFNLEHTFKWCHFCINTSFPGIYDNIHTNLVILKCMIGRTFFFFPLIFNEHIREAGLIWQCSSLRFCFVLDFKCFCTLLQWLEE